MPGVVAIPVDDRVISVFDCHVFHHTVLLEDRLARFVLGHFMGFEDIKDEIGWAFKSVRDGFASFQPTVIYHRHQTGDYPRFATQQYGDVQADINAGSEESIPVDAQCQVCQQDRFRSSEFGHRIHL